FSSRRLHTRSKRDWSSDVCSSDLVAGIGDGDSFRQALIAAGSLRNIQVGGRNLGVQAFDNGVASHNHLRGFFFMPTRIAALTVQLRFVFGVVNAVFCLRGWAFAF